MTGILAVLGSSQAKKGRILELSGRLKHRDPYWTRVYQHGAKDVAEYLGAVHHEFHFTVQDVIDVIEDVIYHIESYDVATIRASTPMFLMSRKIKSLGMKMVIYDEGSDLIFGGYLYSHKAPNKKEFHEETCQKIKALALHQYDCLRANKATSAWGLEARVPFLDEELINVAMSIDPELKMIKKDERSIEKWILRKAFHDENHPYLSKEILYRQKEQLGECGVGCSWIDGLKAHAAEHVTDKMMQNASHIYPHNTPTTKEGFYYRMMFGRFFPKNSASVAVLGRAIVACSSMEAAACFNNLDLSGRAAALSPGNESEEEEVEEGGPKDDHNEDSDHYTVPFRGDGYNTDENTDHEDDHKSSSSSISELDTEIEAKTEPIEVEAGEDVVNLNGRLCLERLDHIGSVRRSLRLKTLTELDSEVDEVCRAHFQLEYYKDSKKRYVRFFKEGFSDTCDANDLQLVPDPVEWIDTVSVMDIQFFPSASDKDI